MRPSACSATARAFLAGVFTTATPCRVAASMSTWLVDARHIPTNRSPGASARVSSNTKSASTTRIEMWRLRITGRQFFRVGQPPRVKPTFVLDRLRGAKSVKLEGIERRQYQSPHGQSWPMASRGSGESVQEASERLSGRPHLRGYLRYLEYTDRIPGGVRGGSDNASGRWMAHDFRHFRR